MRLLYFCFSFIITTKLYSQILPFKELNFQDESSSPGDFVKFEDKLFFKAISDNNVEVYQSDGTEQGTKKLNSGNRILKDYFLGNGSLYITGYDSVGSFPLRLWKYFNSSFVNLCDSVGNSQPICINDEILFFSDSGINKVVNGKLVPFHESPFGFLKNTYPPTKIGGYLFFCKYTQAGLELYKTDGLAVDFVRIFSNPVVPFTEYLYQNLIVSNGEMGYIFAEYQDNEGAGVYLHKIFNGQIELVKLIDQSSLVSLGGVIHNLFMNNTQLYFIRGKKELWSSDGTVSNTQLLRSFQYLNYDFYNKRFGVLGDLVFFGVRESDEGQLWKTDGSVSGTSLEASFSLNEELGYYGPHYFQSSPGHVFFRIGDKELWKTNGIVESKSHDIPRPINNYATINYSPEIINTSDGQIVYIGYDDLRGLEPWIASSDFSNRRILKNLNQGVLGSFVNETKIKFSGKWFFQAKNEFGPEIWVSDGTFNGTRLLKDLNSGLLGLNVLQFLPIDNMLFILVRFENESRTRIFKTDGTEVGTKELNLDLLYPNGVNFPNKVASLNGQLAFFYNSSSGIRLYLSDGTVSGTSFINVYIPSVPYDIISIEGKVLFLLGGIWVSDGTISGTKRIYAGSQSSTENPFSAVCLLSFKGKGYFFSQFYDATTLTIKSGFYVTDGTDAGTYILKYFGSIDLVDSRLLFISNSAEKIYFRNLPYSSIDSTSFNLWSSNGTSIGTKLVSTLSLKASPRIKFGANLGNWFLSVRNGYRINSKNQLWVTQGDSLTLLNENNSPDYYFSEIVNQDSISYFSLFDTGYGLELWSSDGTKNGTGLKKEIYKGVQNSEIINILDFSNFLLFFGDKGNRNIELFKYELPKCENGQNESARSGEWMSKYTWACGRIPSLTENPKILSGNSVTIPAGSQLLLKNIVVESGGVLSIESGSTVKIIPEN